MKFTVNKKEITDAVLNIQRAVSTKTSIPVLEGILIKTGELSVEMSAYDLELGIKTVIAATGIQEGTTVLSAKLFSEIVRKSPAEIITVEVDEKHMATIVSGHSNFSIIGFLPEEFPELPKLEDSTIFNLPSKMLKSMIRQTSFAIAESDAKPIHQGGLFNIQDGRLDMVAVDGYRLAKRSELIDFKDELSFVIPGKTLREVNSLLKDEDDLIEIAAGKRHVLFKIGNYTVTSSLLEGDFLNYKATIPTETGIEVIVNTRKVIESVERVSLLITDRLKSPLRCTFEDDSIKLLCTTAMGRASDQIEASIQGENIEIGFNSRYLLDALKNTECDEIKIQLNTALSPMKIVPKEGDSFLFLVLPVKLKSN
ncbi:DNA polymerase III subunit beta [Scatolibacter rhodanostii]|uniref:DNA polymerase III subunit beta n=1 Tax=Scatolibacter rhodanostii TaxID=2014781 RepID=UPI000C07BAD7|nr:DNA polymerase III subunit beta [Scatolibacter rhodanostii]